MLVTCFVQDSISTFRRMVTVQKWQVDGLTRSCEQKALLNTEPMTGREEFLHFRREWMGE